VYRLATLHLLLLAALAGGTYLILARLEWQARLTTGWGSYLLNLDRGPAWDPPPLPPRDRFEAAFANLPPGGVITREVRWDSLEPEAGAVVWVIALGFTPPYLWLRGGRRAPVFQVCTRLAWTLPAWVGVSVVLWVVVGGWGPPCCGCCLVCGFAHGAIAGLLGWWVPAPATGGGSDGGVR
jgi:hypothetical protein